MIQAALQNIRNDIGNLTNLFQERNNETSPGNEGQERLHIVMMKQKDDEIAQLKVTIQDLRKFNDNLTNDQLKSMKQMEEQTSLIKSLQLGMEATSKLNDQYECDKIANLDLAEAMKRQLAEAAEAKQKMGDEIDNANEANQKLHEEVVILKQYSNDMITELNSQIEALAADIAATGEMNAETIRVNIKLREDLAVSERRLASKEDELKDLHRALSEVQKPIETSDKGSQTQVCFLFSPF